VLLSAAIAQNQSPAPASPPASPPPAASQKQDAKPPAAASADQQVIVSQRPDQWLASKFSGTDVVGADGKKVGDVTDVLFDRQGKVLAYVVSVGGFLGIGSKDVALAPSVFEVMPGSNGAADKLKISMSQEQFKQMARFEPYKAPQPRPATTGSGSGGLGRPSPASGTNR
jgi:hypothetical protein